MRRKYVFAIAALAATLAMPTMAHHMSIDPEFVEEQVPADALDQHIAVVDEVLDMGVAEMEGEAPGATTMTGDTAMDPADMGSWSGSANATDPNALREPPTLP